MKHKLIPLLTVMISGSFFGSSAFAQEPASNDEDIIELSPFTVQADSDVGYMATSTLAGSRLNTPLRNVASAVSVITPEVFEDTGATDASTILSYALSTETGGLQGNFAGSGFDGSAVRTDDDETRVNPQGNQRVRGLGSATLTRNFFLTEIPFDSYNSSRAEINRGPNSILFGLGSPGGIINNTVNNAVLGNDFGNVAIRFGAHGTYRGTFDINKVVLDGRLAVRLDGLYDDTSYQQDPAFKRDKRIYGALKGVLFENKKTALLGPTTIRANFESGDISSTPPSALPPNNIYHAWWEGLTVDYEKYTGSAPFDRLLPPNFVPKFTANTLVDRTVPDMNTVADIPNFTQVAIVYADPNSPATPGFSTQFPNAVGFQGRLNDFDPDTPGNQLFDMFFTRSPELETYSSGFITPSIQDRNVFDYRNKLFSGDMDRLTQDFNAYNITLEQSFFDDNSAGVEVAFDKQDWSRWSRLIINSEVAAVFGNKDVAIDISEYLGNKEPNPTLGRAVVRIDRFGDYSTQNVDREVRQATAYYTLDTEKFSERWGSWLGRHTFTGFLSRQDFTTESRRHSNTWAGDGSDLGGRGGGWNRRVQAYTYVSNDLRSTSGPGDVRLQQLNIPVPVEGDQFPVWYQLNSTKEIKAGVFEIDSVVDGGDINRRKINSEAFIVQSNFLKEHLVTMFGWRKDKATNYENLTTAQIAEASGSPGDRGPDGGLKEEYFLLQSEPSQVAEGSTFTASAVAHVPEGWTDMLPGKPRFSLHWGESENFNPAGLRRSVWGDVLSPPTGTTEEYGFSIDLMNSKFIARFNWFETSLNGANAGINAVAADRVSFYLDRAIVGPKNAGISWEDAKAYMLADTPGPDPIPNIQSYDQLEAVIRGLMPPELATIYDIRIVENNGVLEIEQEGVPGRIATADQVAKGFEVDLIGQITESWRLMLNIGKQETTQSNSAVEYSRLVEFMHAKFEASGLLPLRDSPASGGEITPYGQRWNTLVLSPLASVVAKDGTVSLEQRRWRVNLLTNYDFRRDSPLGGFGIGGAIRWQDEAAVGYDQYVNEAGVIAPRLNNPYFAPSTWNGDVWVSYRRKLTDSINWKIQLNIRNAFGDDEDIPSKINPDGQVAVIRVPNERIWFITNTFSF